MQCPRPILIAIAIAIAIAVRLFRRLAARATLRTTASVASAAIRIWALNLVPQDLRDSL